MKEVLLKIIHRNNEEVNQCILYKCKFDILGCICEIQESSVAPNIAEKWAGSVGQLCYTRLGFWRDVPTEKEEMCESRW